MLDEEYDPEVERKLCEKNATELISYMRNCAERMKDVPACVMDALEPLVRRRYLATPLRTSAPTRILLDDAACDPCLVSVLCVACIPDCEVWQAGLRSGQEGLKPVQKPLRELLKRMNIRASEGGVFLTCVTKEIRGRQVQSSLGLYGCDYPWRGSTGGDVLVIGHDDKHKESNVDAFVKDYAAGVLQRNRDAVLVVTTSVKRSERLPGWLRAMLEAKAITDLRQDP